MWGRSGMRLLKKKKGDLVHKSGHNLAASEIVIRDGGISERVMSHVREVTFTR